MSNSGLPLTEIGIFNEMGTHPSSPVWPAVWITMLFLYLLNWIHSSPPRWYTRVRRWAIPPDRRNVPRGGRPTWGSLPAWRQSPFLFSCGNSHVKWLILNRGDVMQLIDTWYNADRLLNLSLKIINSNLFIKNILLFTLWSYVLLGLWVYFKFLFKKKKELHPAYWPFGHIHMGRDTYSGLSFSSGSN